jgi:hypothetical protein
MATSNGPSTDNRFIQMARPVSFATKASLRFLSAAARCVAGPCARQHRPHMQSGQGNHNSSSKPADGFHPRAGSWGVTRHFLAAALAVGISSAALAQSADVALKVTPAELKVIAKALDAPRIRAQAQPLVIKLQSQIDAAIAAGPYATELPLPAIRGLDR